LFRILNIKLLNDVWSVFDLRFKTCICVSNFSLVLWNLYGILEAMMKFRTYFSEIENIKSLNRFFSRV